MLHPKLLELQKQFKPSILTPINSPLLKQKQIECWIKRDDLIHPVISGNKWRKLKYIINHALNMGADTIISMGGAYSNHLHALAFVGKQLNLTTIGYIRGEKPKLFSPTLLDLEKWGMQLRFVSRTDYRQLRRYKKHQELPSIENNQYWLPEGGATELALKGVAEIVSEIDIEFDTLCVPCGTGTTLAGVIKSITEKQVAIGFSALKGGGFLVDDVNELLGSAYTKNNSVTAHLPLWKRGIEGDLFNKASPKPSFPKRGTEHLQNNWSIQLDYHFGGFAKSNNELLLSIEDFTKQYGVMLEPVYTGKMFYGLFEMIRQDYFKPRQKLVVIHTGGLQGARPLHIG